MFQAEISWNPTKSRRQTLTRLTLIITKCPEEIKKITDIDFSMTIPSFCITRLKNRFRTINQVYRSFIKKKLENTEKLVIHLKHTSVHNKMFFRTLVCLKVFLSEE